MSGILVVPSYDEDGQLCTSSTATLKSRRRKGVVDLHLPSPTPPPCITRSDSADWRLIHCSLTDSDSGSVDAQEEVFEFPRPPKGALETHATFFSRYSHSPQSSSDSSTPSLLSSHGSSHHPSSPTSSGPPTTPPTSPTLSLRGTTPGVVLVRPLSIRKRNATSPPPPKLPAVETDDTPYTDDSEFYAAAASTFVTLSRPPPPAPGFLLTHHHARAPSEVCGPRPRTRSPGSSRPATAPSSTPPVSALDGAENAAAILPRPPFPRRPPPPPPPSSSSHPLPASVLTPHTPPRSSSLQHSSPPPPPPPSSFRRVNGHQHSPSNSISSTSSPPRHRRVPNFSRPTSQIALLPSNSKSTSSTPDAFKCDSSMCDFPAASTRDSSYSLAAEYAAYAPLLRTPTPGVQVTFKFGGIRAGVDEEDGEIHVHPWTEDDDSDEEGEEDEEENTPYQLSPLIAPAPVPVPFSEDDEYFFFDDRGHRRGRSSWDADADHDAYGLLLCDEEERGFRGGRGSTESTDGSSYSHSLYPASSSNSHSAYTASSACEHTGDVTRRVPVEDSAASRASAFASPPSTTATSPPRLPLPSSSPTSTPTLRSHWSSSTLSTASHPPSSRTPSKQKRKSSESSSSSSLAFARRYLKGAGGRRGKGGKDMQDEMKNVHPKRPPKPRLRPMGAVSPRVFVEVKRESKSSGEYVVGAGAGAR
ncbi:hypothetical protein R3P38DRAFT_973541 [Favolaschia claudopus]|uniref:Uncharacterized protein n=1 Tax=Favolaschia claudopus TaxID=2862362 RepID=A0AAW0E3S5_9AGAR